MKGSIVVIAALVAAPAFAALPPAPEAAVAQAKEAKAKSAWGDKVAAYQLCQSMDRTADAYRKARKEAGQPVPSPTQTPPCTDPGPYVPAVAATKPLEASGAHSPTETAAAPPSSNATAAQLQGSKKTP